MEKRITMHKYDLVTLGEKDRHNVLFGKVFLVIEVILKHGIVRLFNEDMGLIDSDAGKFTSVVISSGLEKHLSYRNMLIKKWESSKDYKNFNKQIKEHEKIVRLNFTNLCEG